MYKIDQDPSHNRVTITVSEGYSHDQDTFHAELRRAIVAVTSEGGDFDMLVDMIDVPVTPQERIEKVQALVQWCLANGLRHCAFAVSSMTQEMQFKRISDRNEKLRYFRSHSAAENWLDGIAKAA